ncbi:carboxypeptidase regulatory-like domain-containing protein, partial [Actinacidiphila rubida]
FGLPACTTDNGCFRKTDQRGGVDYPADDQGWSLETALDLDAVSSACPACHILLVEGDTASVEDLGAATRTAVALGAKYVSNSYGLPGEDASLVADSDYDHPGVVVTASAGDSANVVNWPASDPDVVSVGGTLLTRAADTTRGWKESAWSGSGSGCSAYEQRPAYQVDLDTACSRRAITDISAVADPNSGLAVYNSLDPRGWLQVGGTSLSSPLVAAMYALAGEPAAGTYPVTYPYAFQGKHLNDVTEGSAGSCGTVLCDAGPGWDGPTGLGSPDGVAALTLGAHGTASGRVTDTTGAPVNGASVLLTGKDNDLRYHATTDASGAFQATVGAGAYDVSATAYGYADGTGATLTVTGGGTATGELTLRKVPTRTVSGKVTDASGHGWPLYARITVDGYPGGALHSDPRTGEYHVDLPEQADYTLHVTPDQPGYVARTATVSLGAQDVRADLPVQVERTGCVAPGYAYPAQADFEGWTGPRNGWTAVDHGSSGHAWEFGDPHEQWNLTGGSGDFATADPYDNNGAAEDADLLSPVMDLTHETDDHLRFNYGFAYAPGSEADVAFSVDGGTTWTTVFRTGEADSGGSAVAVPLTGALGHKDVRVRFHYSGSGVTIFEIDDVSVGTCGTRPGGIVQGTVTDANTHKPVVGATVTDGSAVTASLATPDDPALGDGFYWLFTPVTGVNTVTTAAPRYATSTARTTVAADTVRTYAPALAAGRLTVSGGDLALSAESGHRATREITVTNTGGAPLHVNLHEQHAGGDTTVPTAAGPATQLVKGTFPDGPATPAAAAPSAKAPRAASSARTAAPASASGTVWQELPEYPEQVMDNASATYQGRTYSVGGVDKILGGQWVRNSYVYDPSKGAWSTIAPLPVPLESPAAAFVDGTLYVAGGWALQGTSAVPVSTVYAYHPASDTWTRAADLPSPLAAASTAVLDGRLYVIGGCPDACDTVSSHTYRYTPATDSWQQVADYPLPVHWTGCAGTDGAIACAGGLNEADGHADAIAGTYVYHPRTNTWTKGADVPYVVWAEAANGGNGQLQIAGGISDDGGMAVATNRVMQYDPLSDSWRALPNADHPIFRTSASGCGLTQVGGAVSPGPLSFPEGSRPVQTLPGFGQCGDDQVPWLSENRTGFDLAPGHSVTIRVTADGSAVASPGTYDGVLSLTTDTPYVTAPVKVTFTVTARHPRP